MNVWVAGAAVLLTVAGCLTDLRALKIPNVLTASFAAAGLIYHISASGWQGFVHAAIGCLAGLMPLLLLFWFGGIGGGDVKWFGAFGIWTGAEMVLRLLFCSIITAGGIAVLLLALRAPGIRRLGQKLPWPWGRHPALPGKGAVFPFMLAVAPGFIWLCASMQYGTGG